jgi:hypothetical protein
MPFSTMFTEPFSEVVLLFSENPFFPSNQASEPMIEMVAFRPQLEALPVSSGSQPDGVVPSFRLTNDPLMSN